MKTLAGRIWHIVRIVLGAAAGLILLLVAVMIGKWTKRTVLGVLGTVRRVQNWEPVKSDPTMILVKDKMETVRVRLPLDSKGKQITSDMVSAAGLPTGGGDHAQVELKHKKVDRHPRGVASNAVNGGD